MKPVVVFLAAAMVAAGVLPGRGGTTEVTTNKVSAASASQLWGRDGLKWTPASRLPDFSFAGYHCGERSLPDVPVVTDVKAHGAKGDGQADDTGAFRHAVESASKGAILVPAGRYVLSDTITIAKSGAVLRGAGTGRTILVIPRSLEQVHGTNMLDGGKSKWAFSGGFIEIQGRDTGGKLAEVTVAASRGDCRLTVNQSAVLSTGAWVRLLMNDAASLGRHLHADQKDAAETTRKEMKHLCDWVARVTAVEGHAVVLDRPLRLDVRPEWAPELWSWQPAVEESGIESLTFEFAGVPKRPHLKEEGFNAIHMRGAANCWVRNVEVVDADNGVIAGGCRFCQVEGFRDRAARRSHGDTGHHALWAAGKSQDCLFTGFHLETTFVHDLTVEGCACGNVFERGQGVAIDLDHHSNAPYENLFTDIDVGSPARLWNCGGRVDRGPHAGARTTIWNLRYTGSKPPPKVPDWPQINVVGVSGYKPHTTADGEWVEPCDGSVEPSDLYRAQLARRLAKSNP